MAIFEKQTSSNGSEDGSIQNVSVSTDHGLVEAGGPKSPFSFRSGEVHVSDVERVPGSPYYYQKDGLRTAGDDQDHEYEPPLTVKRFMTFFSLAMLWVGSQMPTYLFGSIPPYIYDDIGGHDRYIWFVIGHLLALASTAPFVGSISDLIGRRYACLIGCGFIIIGNIICATATNMNNFIAGMVFTGVGAGMNELMAISGAAELAPTSKRGMYVGAIIFSIIPMLPSVLYSQLIASHAGWRYVGIVCGGWSAIAFVLTFIFYHPPPRINSYGLTKSQVLRQIDWIGGFLSISGMILFMAGLQWGGYQYSWKSAHVLVPLILGAVLLIAFFVWEAYFAPFPLFPKRLHKEPRMLALILVVTFISGANFFSILMFWPTQGYNMYGHNPVSQGIRGLPSSTGILTGAVTVLLLLSYLKGHNRILLVISTVFMTAGTAAMSAASLTNESTMCGILFLAGVGVGGIVVPCNVIVTIICPDDLIATVTALTLAVRVLGGAIGYCVYYNVYVAKLVPNLIHYVGGAMEVYMHSYNRTLIKDVIELTAQSKLAQIAELPGFVGNETAIYIVTQAGKIAFQHSYCYVYYVSIAFGAVSIFAACFLGDVGKYMDEHVAVVME